MRNLLSFFKYFFLTAFISHFSESLVFWILALLIYLLYLLNLFLYPLFLFLTHILSWKVFQFYLQITNLFPICRISNKMVSVIILVSTILFPDCVSIWLRSIFIPKFNVFLPFLACLLLTLNSSAPVLILDFDNSNV